MTQEQKDEDPTASLLKAARQVGEETHTSVVITELIEHLKRHGSKMNNNETDMFVDALVGKLKDRQGLVDYVTPPDPKAIKDLQQRVQAREELKQDIEVSAELVKALTAPPEPIISVPVKLLTDVKAILTKLTELLDQTG